MALRRFFLVAAVVCCVVALVACSDGGGGGDDGLPVGSACALDAECAGPGVPQCMTGGLYPLAGLASSQDPTAQGLADIGVPLPGGYCSTVPPCATNADCGAGGSCFFPLKDVDPAYFATLVAALGLQPADAAILEGFLSYGQCLDACRTNADCTRAGYVCATPIDDFLSLVEGADRGTFCIGASPACDPACVHGTCDTQAAPPACTCEAGWEGAACDQNIDDCDPNPCQNGGTCTDGVAGFTCACAQGFTGPTCETAVQGCADSPCVHGTCQDTGPGAYACTCEAGWEGVNCDQNVDDCDPNPCQNGGTCLDQVDGYQCECLPGFGGPDCELAQTTSCVLTYTLVRGNGDDGNGYTGCNLRIRDAMAGNGTHAVGPGTLVLRVPSDGGQNPAAGLAEVLYYHLPIEFSQSIMGTVITTDVDSSSPALGETGNTLEMALGELALGATPTLTWNACTYPDGYNDTIHSFTPDVEGTGDGCLAPYLSQGNVNCSGGLCGAAGLASGDNPQDEAWEQALQTLTFSADLATFSMPFMQVPERNAARTHVSWGGALESAVCQ